MKKGIVFEISTTNFDEVIKLCEQAFDECCNDSDSCFIKGWNEVKTSRDFETLSNFLTTHDIDNKIFSLKE